MDTDSTKKCPKNTGGRPTVITPAVVLKLIEAFKLDVTVEEACLYAGISKDTYYRKVKDDKEFSDEMDRAMMYATIVARQTVIREIETNGSLALKYLERKRKSEFSPRSEFHIDDMSIAARIALTEEKAQYVDWEHPDVSLLKSKTINQQNHPERPPRQVPENSSDPGAAVSSQSFSPDQALGC